MHGKVGADAVAGAMVEIEPRLPKRPTREAIDARP